MIGGVPITVEIARAHFCHSRMLFVRAYSREMLEHGTGAHGNAIAFSNGACPRGTCDNMKRAVNRECVGRDSAYNRRFQQMCGRYLGNSVARPRVRLGEAASLEPSRHDPTVVLRAATETSAATRRFTTRCTTTDVAARVVLRSRL